MKRPVLVSEEMFVAKTDLQKEQEFHVVVT